MSELAHLLVDRDAPTRPLAHPYTDLSASPLPDGHVLVHIAKLVVTANTLTYALCGKMRPLNYFQHFPAPPGAPGTSAAPPCWGVGVVAASRCAGVSAGTRIYGLFPFSPAVLLLPRDATAASFVDAAPHRAGLLEPYRTYFTSEAQEYRGLAYEEEDYHLSTGALFSTGWSMAHTVATHPSKPTALVLTSASSRTSRAAAYAAKFGGLPLEVVGLTSAANLEFVRRLGLYDTVCTYGEVPALPRQRVAIQDVAGDARINERLYQHFGDGIVYFGTVGMSHMGPARARAAIDGLGGVAPSPFLVFTAIEALGEVYGRQECGGMLRDATRAYRARALPEFRAVRRHGIAETRATFEEMAAGGSDPACTYVCSLWPEGLHEPTVATSKL